MSDAEILAGSRLFQGMTGERLQAALTQFDAKSAEYRRGDYLLRPGARLERFGLVLSGVIQVNMDDFNGQRMIMSQVGPAGSFGESLAYLRVPEPMIYIIAVSDCRVLWLSPACVSGSANEADFSSRFIALLAQRALEMNDRIQILSKHSLREKLIAFFSQCARGREDAVGGARRFTLEMDRNAMADYLGADRSALSRELSRMEAEGLIDYHKNRFELLTL